MVHTPQLLSCLLCKAPFVGQVRNEKRPLFEKVKRMKRGRRDNLARIGEQISAVCPAVCEDCRKGKRRLPFVNFDLEEEEYDVY